MVPVPKKSIDICSDNSPGYIKRAAKVIGDYYLTKAKGNQEAFFSIDMGIIFRGERKHIHIFIEQIPNKHCDECYFREMKECSGDKCSEVLPDTKKIKTICDQCLEDPKTCKIKSECEELRNNANNKK